MAYFLAEHGRSLEEAERTALDAVRSSPGNTAYTDTLGYVYFRRGRLESASRLYEGLTRKDPASPSVRVHHAELLLALGKHTAARREAEEALRLPNTSSIQRAANSILERTK